MSLGPDARALISAAGDGDDPSDDDAARVRGKIAVRLAVAASVGAAAGSATKAATAATAGTVAGAGGSALAGATGASVLGTTTAKILLAVALVGGTTATGAVVFRSSAPAPSTATLSPQRVSAPLATPARTTPSLDTPPAPSSPPAFDEPSPVPSLPVARAPAGNAQRSTSSNVLSRQSEPPAVPSRVDGTSNEPAAATAVAPTAVAAAAPPPSDSIADEAAILRSAQSALARGDGASALARIGEHANRFPHGALAEERNAARVFALCASGRTAEARTAAASFVASSPRSPLVAQVRRSCAERIEPAHD